MRKKVENFRKVKKTKLSCFSIINQTIAMRIYRHKNNKIILYPRSRIQLEYKYKPAIYISFICSGGKFLFFFGEKQGWRPHLTLKMNVRNVSTHTKKFVFGMRGSVILLLWYKPVL